MNSVKEIDIKNRAYYFFDDIMINIKNLNPNKVKIDEKSNKNVLYIVYVTVKNLT